MWKFGGVYFIYKMKHVFNPFVFEIVPRKYHEIERVKEKILSIVRLTFWFMTKKNSEK